MDQVYIAAHVTIGLYSTILEQRQLEDLLRFDEQVENSLRIKPRGSVDLRFRGQPVVHARNLDQVLEKVVNDPWNTRAWILSGDIRIVRLVGHTPEDDSAMQSLERFQWFHPYARKEHFPEISVGGTRPRDVCDAATALSFLRFRENNIPADRLAIVANLCGYELRLNTASLAICNMSLSVCIIALSLMNGDFSLITPEVFDRYRPLYQHLATSKTSSYSFSGLGPSKQISGFHDLPIAYINNLPTIHSNFLAPRGANLGSAAPESYFFTGRDIRLPGFFGRSKGLLHFQRSKKAEYRDKSRQSKQLGDRFSIQTAFMEHEKRRERAVTQIPFEILMTLRDRKEVMAANSIWQSVWNPLWPNAQKTWSIIELVDKFDRNTRIESWGDMFRLNRLDISTFHPEWLIKRIMMRGGIWLANLIRNSSDDDYPTSEEGRSDTELKKEHLRDLFDEAYERNEANSHDDGSNVSRKAKEDPAVKSLREDPQFTEMLKNKLLTAYTGFMLRQIMEIFMTVLSQYPTHANVITYTPSQAYYHQWILFSNIFDTEIVDQGSLLGGQCAIFDIDAFEDGKTLILTPFVLSFENVDSPNLRNMSVSHIVERNCRRDGNEKYESFRTASMVQGVWQVMLYPGGRYP
ncbi:hypothetical protein K432DRAFT_396401 [Lepidopterella palustris CBS 459.81]|uniref:Heterokaryon incompatibility domain-containing protein n=1 Tax=Lepidopterella palustris CBS 459.81 TaxID=1314670 RepID=A0A8E2JC02_9PEZI|nr:hypothetical protein K432DRAFT_396401 [Lepidopterella palustris CBS 459.81]